MKTTQAPADGHPDLAVVDVTGATGVVDLTVEVVRTFTPDHPGAVRVELENLMDDRTVSHRAHVPFEPDPVVREGGGGAVIPVPADGDGVFQPCEGRGGLHPGAPVEGCWQYPYEAVGVHDLAGGVGPGEVEATTYHVYDYGATDDCSITEPAFSDDRCLVAGDYRVEQEYDLEDREEPVTLGFTLGLSY